MKVRYDGLYVKYNFLFVSPELSLIPQATMLVTLTGRRLACPSGARPTRSNLWPDGFTEPEFRFFGVFRRCSLRDFIS